ncbi:MAG: hypothetical protein MJ133_00090 [Lachnospiraceae bacterium]|nr:hypothetical protein [Lachnospiraceae bacterium]
MQIDLSISDIHLNPYIFIRAKGGMTKQMIYHGEHGWKTDWNPGVCYNRYGNMGIYYSEIGDEIRKY